MESLRVLHVEDSPADRELTRRHLERQAPHLKLREAETVAEALDQLVVGDVDLVLADYRLPDATGLDLLEAIKARGLHVPVVLVTGSGDVEAAVRLLKAGATDYVVKRPGYLETLLPVLEGALRWFQSASELRRTAVRVLYAEHDPVDVELTRRAFSEHGPHLRLEVAPRGQEALARLRTVTYDLLLLDYRLPDLSGIEILKAMREERIRVPVVMTTGQGDEEIAAQAFKLGAVDYIIKREGYLAKLPSTLENVLAQRRLAEEKEALLVLNSLAESIATVRDLSELGQRVARAATHLLRAEMSVLWLVDGAELRPVGWVGMDESVGLEPRFRVDVRLLDLAAVERREAIRDLLAAARVSGAPAAGRPERTAATLAVSLVTAGQVIGMLAVASYPAREFDATEQRLLTILADHAAIAIDNARLYQQLKDQFEELQRTQEQLLQSEKLAAMGTLLAGVAHELNNPLAVILGQTALLRLMVGDEAFAKRVDNLAQAAERCARIVRSFLSLARQRPPEQQRVSLNQVVQEAMELLAYQLRVDNVEVTLDRAMDLPALWGDPHQLHQVVINLVSNAHHAMRETPPPRRLTLTTRFDQGQGRVSLEVADTGPGIPPDIQSRIFEPLFTTKPVGQGTGLGLALCYRVVEDHGGSIRVESPPGHGAILRIELPVRAPSEVAPEARGTEMLPLLPGKRILVVDDEPGVVDILAALLSLDGHQVETAANGARALDKLREQSYDLILSDIRMPELDGPSLYQEVARHHPELGRRVIFLTGDTLSPETREFLERTGAPSLSKPSPLEEMRRAVRRVLLAPGADWAAPAAPSRDH